MPAPLYGRYVPPKPAKKSKLFALSPPSKSLQQEPSSDAWTREQERPAEQPFIANTHHDATEVSQDFDLDQAPGRGKEQPKKRKRGEAKVDEDSLLEPESTPKKHKAVLSKFEKSARRAETARKSSHIIPTTVDDETETELHDLTPLPQPKPVPDTPFESTFSHLPNWLANPSTVASSHTASFESLGVGQDYVKKLEQRGYQHALAVQTVLLPAMRPGMAQHQGDICVSARTGSGKTLAYMLPIVEACLKERFPTELSAIIIVPTRQLVDQARQVAEELCAGTRLKVGTAVGNVPFTTEQQQLVELRMKRDEKRAAALQKRADDERSTGFKERGRLLDDFATLPPGYVPHYESAIDILVCTPGRLVEHLEATTGFLLRDLRWLIIDEADQLLKQDFQGWADALMENILEPTPDDFETAQEKICRRNGWPASKPVRKVVLSATMQRDVGKLGLLRLKRPKLMVVEDEDNGAVRNEDGDSFELPTTLSEHVAQVGDGSHKPLHLLHLLETHVFGDVGNDSKVIRRALIFTKNNENVGRLSLLLSTLLPAYKNIMGMLSKSTTTKEAQEILASFGRGKLKILIASDRASRGLDVAGLTHVINYDIPNSVTSYVHRVGRTARAGKEGDAWTLVTKSEAAWFWNEIARGNTIRRGSKRVDRFNFKDEALTQGRKWDYEAALQALQDAVEGTAQ